MQSVKVRITDGRYLVNTPDCIIIDYPDYANCIFVDANIWNEYTNNAVIKPYARGQQFTLTLELLNALKKVSIENPQKTQSAIPSNLKDNTCTRCGGLGKIEAYQHINGGTCFECNGTGKI